MENYRNFKSGHEERNKVSEREREREREREGERERERENDIWSVRVWQYVASTLRMRWMSDCRQCISCELYAHTMNV